MLRAGDVAFVDDPEIPLLGGGQQVAEQDVGPGADGVAVALLVGQAGLGVAARLLGGDVDVRHHQAQDGDLLEVGQQVAAAALGGEGRALRRHAVFEAAKIYHQNVQSKSQSMKEGQDLMLQVWNPKNGTLKVTKCVSSTDKNVQEGIAFLSAGLMRAIRNPTAHVGLTKFYKTYNYECFRSRL